MTFEEEYKKTMHGIQRYFWVIPVDSIKLNDRQAYPLFVSNYSKSQLSDCKAGKSIDPTIPSIDKGDYDFDSLRFINHDELMANIIRKKRLLQTIKKIWPEGNEITVKIYATPISATFCTCDLALSGQQRFNYKGMIFLADYFSEGDNEFWNSKLKSFITKQDFSNIDFKKLAYPSKIANK